MTLDKTPTVVSKSKCPVSLIPDSRRRGGGKVGIPRTLRDFQARWESRFLDFSSARLFHGLAGRQFPMENRTAALVIATQAVGPIAEAQGPVQVLACNHGAARQRRSPAHGFDLQSQVLKADRVVPVHRALALQRKDARQVLAPDRAQRQCPVAPMLLGSGD